MIEPVSLILAFVGGGILCVIAQLLIDLTKLTPARILVLYVSVGVLLYAVGIFDPMKEIFGAGVTLPLIGFGANIAKGVKEFPNMYIGAGTVINAEQANRAIDAIKREFWQG